MSHNNRSAGCTALYIQTLSYDRRSLPPLIRRLGPRMQEMLAIRLLHIWVVHLCSSILSYFFSWRLYTPLPSDSAAATSAQFLWLHFLSHITASGRDRRPCSSLNSLLDSWCLPCPSNKLRSVTYPLSAASTSPSSRIHPTSSSLSHSSPIVLSNISNKKRWDTKTELEYTFDKP